MASVELNPGDSFTVVDSTVSPPAAPTPFGDTVPYYKIAEHYGLDYGDVLVLADFATHNRMHSELRSSSLGEAPPLVQRIMLDFANAGRSSELRDFDRAMGAQVLRFRDVQNGAPF